MKKEVKQIIAADLEMIINTIINADLDDSVFQNVRVSVNHILETINKE